VSADAAAFSGPVRPTHNPPRRLVDLTTAVAALTALAPIADDVAVTGVTHDSGQVQHGDLFAALPGARQHGVAFVDRAVTRGAVAVLTEPAAAEAASRTGLPVLLADDPRACLGPVAGYVYGDPSADLLLIGVTGTNGKTTSSYFIEAGLRAAGHRTGLIGTVETRIGDVALPSAHTTPEAPDLQALFAVMRERDVTGVSMEVSSHALALHRVDGTSFAVAVFTNLSQDHLDFHGDLESYFAAKARLFTPTFTDVAVVNVDDAYGERLARDAQTRVVSVSPSGADGADWRVTDLDAGANGTVFVLHGPDGARTTARTQLAGTFNVTNAALAVVALVEAGASLSDAVNGVASCTDVPGRMHRVDAGQSFTALVDYAHTPDAVSRLLAALRPVATGRLIVVLGCGGDRDRAKRPLMGAAAARWSDVAILTSDNPRSEDPLAILAAMQEGVAEVAPAQRADVHVEPDRRAAIRLAVSLAGPGDVVAVAGKGHERVQEIAGERFPFDDAEELSAAIRTVVRTS
jgi:UDP-N-acetylmuramoyl-L-alanyl-D-glutamate--2,6-diaminopimelate ligase